ncbi:hypothetical protein ACFLZL_00280 [Thermodesulfobacteriota bacterium]
MFLKIIVYHLNGYWFEYFDINAASLKINHFLHEVGNMPLDEIERIKQMKCLEKKWICLREKPMIPGCIESGNHGLNE